MKQKRIEYIDVAKALLIILVIIGHVQITVDFTVIKRWIYVFHMPAFFIISGILFNNSKWKTKGLKEYLINKVKTLLIPYLFFEIVGGIFRMIILGTDAINYKGLIYNIMTLHCNIGADWFLPTLFVAEIAYFVTNKYLGKVKYIIFILSLTPLFFNPMNHYVIVLCRFIVAYAYIFIGNSMKKYFIAEQGKKEWIITLGTFTLTIIALFVNGKTEMYACLFKNPVVYLIGSIAGTVFILNISKHIYGEFWDYVGKNTLIIMGTHQIITIFMLIVLEMQVVPIKNSIIAFVTIVIFEAIIIPPINKFLPFLVGKQSNKQS